MRVVITGLEGICKINRLFGLKLSSIWPKDGKTVNRGRCIIDWRHWRADIDLIYPRPVFRGAGLRGLNPSPQLQKSLHKNFWVYLLRNDHDSLY